MPIQKGPANLGTGSVDSTELSNTLDLSAKTVTYRTIVAGDLASNAITTAKVADTAITPAKMANSGAEFGMKNRIINGDFRVWQRGGSGSSFATSAFGPDRWRNYGGNALTLTSSTSFGSPQSLLIQANNTNHGIGQRIEAANIADLAGQTVTISYKIRADNPGTHNFLMYYANSADNFSAETNFVNTAKSYTSNTVTTITHTVTLPAQAANGISVVFQWYNAGAAINITAFIWDVQLEVGSNATPFERRPYGMELGLCQRYYEISGATTNSLLFQGYVASASAIRCPIFYNVAKRAAPTVTIVGSWTYSNGSGLFVANAGVDTARIEWNTAGAGMSYAHNGSAGNRITIESEL